MEADRWRHILISVNFGNVGEDFRKSIVEMANRLCQERSENYLATFLASRFLASHLTNCQLLDKQRLVKFSASNQKDSGKTLRKDVKSNRILQLCAGQNAGSETAIHAVYDIFNEDENGAVLMFDASNAFNSIKREAFLHNTKVISLFQEVRETQQQWLFMGQELHHCQHG